jgi:hypothetical protein
MPWIMMYGFELATFKLSFNKILAWASASLHTGTVTVAIMDVQNGTSNTMQGLWCIADQKEAWKLLSY